MAGEHDPGAGAAMTPHFCSNAFIYSTEDGRYQFQWWALSLIRAKPIEGKEKKGADRGIDGVITFVDDHTSKLKRCLVQVKSGHVSSATIRDLAGAVDREKAEMGVLVTLDAETAPMRKECAEAGFYHSPGWGRDYPRLQIATIDALLRGVEPAISYGVLAFNRGGRIAAESGPRQTREAGLTTPDRLDASQDAANPHPE